MNDKISTHVKKVVARAVCFVLVIMMAALILYMYLVNTVRKSIDDYSVSYKEITFERIYSELDLLKKQADSNAKTVATFIEKDLMQQDLDKMKAEMDKGNFSDEMCDIFQKYSQGISLNGIDNRKNGIVIMTQEGVVEDFSYERASDKKLRTWNEEIKRSWNKELEKDAIDKILNHTTHSIIAMEKTNKGEKDHIKVSELTKETLKEIYYKEGIDGLKNYQFKCAAYITENGDIFAQEDFTHGVKNDNHKLIIVQEFNLYDQIYNVSDDLLNVEDHINNSVYKSSHILNMIYILGVFFVTNIIILIFYFSHLYNYYTGNKDPENVYPPNPPGNA